jgi:hypothetical protein
VSGFDLRALLATLHDHDVQLAQGIPSYSQLAHDAIEADLLGVPVAVCSLAHLRDMKLAQNRTQDKLDLENLPEP